MVEPLRIVCSGCRREIVTPRDANGREIMTARTVYSQCVECFVKTLSPEERKPETS